MSKFKFRFLHKWALPVFICLNLVWYGWMRVIGVNSASDLSDPSTFDFALLSWVFIVFLGLVLIGWLYHLQTLNKEKKKDE